MTFLLLILPASKESGYAEKAGKGHNKKSWLNHIEEIFHTIWSQLYSTMKTGGAGRGSYFSEAGNWLFGGEQLHSASLVLFILFFFFFLFVWFSLFFSSFFSSFSFLLNCPYLNTWVLAFFSFLPYPILGGGEWAAGCVVLSCLLTSYFI